MDHPANYEYPSTPSKKDHIRRLILQPGAVDAPLAGTLEMIRLADASTSTPFEAISYVWGSDVKDCSIKIDGKHVPITTSLDEVLRQVRKPDKSRAVWADSICINQEDTLEKNHQVALMGSIYKTSAHTLICLGQQPEHMQDGRNVRSFVEDIDAMIQQVFETKNILGIFDSFPYPNKNDPLLTDPRWESWFHLVRRPWFSRGWVVQEAALSREVSVLWAGQEIPWTRITRTDIWRRLRASQWLSASLERHDIPALQSHIFNTQRPEEATTFWPEIMRQKIKPMPTLEILQYARSHNLGMPKDRIYAFMSLPSLDGALAACAPEPDYSKQTTHLDVYRQFAILFLQKTSNLDLLCCVEHEGDLFPEQDSWVPRWDCRPGSPFILDASFTKINPEDQQFQIDEEKGQLRTRAILIDSVVYVSDEIAPCDTPAEKIEQVVSLWRRVKPQAARYPGPHDGALSLAFLETLCQGRYDGERDSFQGFYPAEANFARMLQSSNQEDMATYRRDENAVRISSILGSNSSMRRFLLLRRGHFALASAATRVGDVCAILPGASCPLILRRDSSNDNQYRVVGPAYIQSKDTYEVIGMKFPRKLREKCQDWKEWDLPTEEIILC